MYTRAQVASRLAQVRFGSPGVHLKPLGSSANGRVPSFRRPGSAGRIGNLTCRAQPAAAIDRCLERTGLLRKILAWPRLQGKVAVTIFAPQQHGGISVE